MNMSRYSFRSPFIQVMVQRMLHGKICHSPNTQRWFSVSKSSYLSKPHHFTNDAEVAKGCVFKYIFGKIKFKENS